MLSVTCFSGCVYYCNIFTVRKYTQKKANSIGRAVTTLSFKNKIIPWEVTPSGHENNTNTHTHVRACAHTQINIIKICGAAWMGIYYDPKLTWSARCRREAHRASTPLEGCLGWKRLGNTPCRWWAGGSTARERLQLEKTKAILLV